MKTSPRIYILKKISYTASGDYNITMLHPPSDNTKSVKVDRLPEPVLEGLANLALLFASLFEKEEPDALIGLSIRRPKEDDNALTVVTAKAKGRFWSEEKVKDIPFKNTPESEILKNNELGSTEYHKLIDLNRIHESVNDFSDILEKNWHKFTRDRDGQTDLFDKLESLENEGYQVEATLNGKMVNFRERASDEEVQKFKSI